MNIALILLLGAAIIWSIFKTFSFFAEIGAEAFNKDLPDDWTVIDTNQRNRK